MHNMTHPEEPVVAPRMPSRDPRAEEMFRKAREKIEAARREGANELSLTDMELIELPAEIGNLTALRRLNLSGNVSIIPLHSIPSV